MLPAHRHRCRPARLLHPPPWRRNPYHHPAHRHDDQFRRIDIAGSISRSSWLFNCRSERLFSGARNLLFQCWTAKVAVKVAHRRSARNQVVFIEPCKINVYRAMPIGDKDGATIVNGSRTDASTSDARPNDERYDAQRVETKWFERWQSDPTL